jgi:beta-lactamase superfamily II metal-dependent hydrolase
MFLSTPSKGTMHALVEQIKVALALSGYLYPNHWSHPYETTLLAVKNNYLSLRDI